MTPPLFALCAAFSYSVSHVCVRLGSRTVVPMAGLILSLGSSALILSLTLAIRGNVQVDWLAVGVFAFAGLLGPGLGRILAITSVSRLGATRASPVLSAAQPMVTVMLGVLVLSEALGVVRGTGIVLTLSGVLLVVRSGQRKAAAAAAKSAEDAAANDEPAPEPTAGGLRVLLWPIAAGTAFAMASLVRKEGMQVLDDAVFGGVIGVGVALSIWGSVLLVRGQGPALARDLRTSNARWFLASGLASGAANIFILSALRDGDLSLVGPIVSIQPILVALISRVFIQRLEGVDLIVALAAVLATAGTILLSI